MVHRTAFSAVVAALSLFSSGANAFVTPSTTTTPVTTTSTSRTRSSSLSALPEFLTGIFAGSPDETLSPVVEAARQKFWFYFFAGSGAGGIGAAQLPSMFNEADTARASAGTGTTRGGAALDAGPLAAIYYDSEISLADVADAIQKAPTADFISSKSTSLNYMASKGYIEKRDFIQQMEAKKCNPLASYVLYDAISLGKGGVVSPVVYEDKLAAYREGGSAGEVASSFLGDWNSFLAVKVGAFFGLVFCLLVDIGFIANAGIAGFLS